MRWDGMEEEMMLACGEGKRKRGRPRKKWMDEIQEGTGIKLEQLRDATTERKQWRRLTVTVARVLRTDSTR